MRTPIRPKRLLLRLGAAIAVATLVSTASAQLPGLPTPALPALPDVPAVVRDAVPTVENATRLADVRKLRLRELLRGNRATLEPDPTGAPIVRHEIIAVAPTDAALAAARNAGFTVAQTERLDGLDTALVTLQAPQGVSTRRALERMRALDPNGIYDFNHIYSESGVATGVPNRTAAPGDDGGGGARVGLVDGGVNARHPALAGAHVETRTFAGVSTPTLHGTAVASLLAGRADGFRGACPGAQLYAADVYGGLPIGGSASAIARAFSWLAQERVTVVNVSLVGPPNRAMEAIVSGMVSRGYLIVAAVGNDGPAAPPLYPASYPGVIGVTGVNAQSRALVEAARGDQVDFAAPGADMAAADAAQSYAPVRGTSFAAPIVAGLLARRLASPDREAAARAIRELAAQAEDLGAKGRDPVYGAGLVGRAVRMSPSATMVRR